MTTFKTIRVLARCMRQTRWKLNSNNLIRTDVYENQCPLAYMATVVTGNHYGSNQTGVASQELGISESLRSLIVNAADDEDCSDVRLLKRDPFNRMRKFMMKVARV